uniref:AAA+ ATPase domain-containing protein n=1 Tax=Bracon brevicornis TaxID=1563983 RepID=A0A6V7I1E8_9HYME
MSSLRISDPPPSRRLNSIETLSTNSSDAPESNYQEEIIEPQQKKSKELKRGVRSLIPKQVSTETISTNVPPRGSSRSPERRISQSLSKLSFCALISLMMVIIATMLVDFSQRPYDFTNATLELREKIFGQSEAIESLINHFQINSNNFTVIMMVGGTGVGKTYTANIIKKHFPYKYNIFELLPPIESHPRIYASLSHLHCNLIIVDNLKMENAREFVNLTKFVQEQKQRPCVVMIGIVNPQVVDEYLVKTVDLERTVGFLENLIDREKARGKVIPFKSLDSETIGRCIRREAEESQVVLDDKDYREVEAQLAAANSGCKGAYAKVSLFKKKERRRRLDLQWDD